MTIPKASLSTDIEIVDKIDTSRTYKLNETNIQGYVDGWEALKQAVNKVLNTEKYEYPIYSFSYGIELDSLIGKDVSYVKVELKRRIQECLLRDDRIESVDNFNFSVTGDQILCTFDVISIYGEITITKEVNL
ncbi:MAG: Phage-like element protein XkdS [Bacillota bacterium]|nr:Phage-like element protein XkdS [Bacillota bacterium]